MIWTDTYLASLLSDAEQDISHDLRCIAQRFSLEIHAGQDIYDIPDNVTGIIRVTWQGHTVWPLVPDEVRNSIRFTPLTSSVGSNRPLHYLRQDYGVNKVQFFPAPTVNIVSDDSTINTQAGIRSQVIFMVWRESSPCDEIYQIPVWYRRQLLRYYAMHKAYLKEGVGQNVKASDYFKKKFDFAFNNFKQSLISIHKARQTVLSPNVGTVPIIARPVLPVNFGTVMDE